MLIDMLINESSFISAFIRDPNEHRNGGSLAGRKKHPPNLWGFLFVEKVDPNIRNQTGEGLPLSYQNLEMMCNMKYIIPVLLGKCVDEERQGSLGSLEEAVGGYCMP